MLELSLATTTLNPVINTTASCPSDIQILLPQLPKPPRRWTVEEEARNRQKRLPSVVAANIQEEKTGHT